MNWDQMAGRWSEIKGRVREQWGKLTDDDLDVISGRREQLVGLIQRRYGAAREEVERQVNDFENQLDRDLVSEPVRPGATGSQAGSVGQGGRGPRAQPSGPDGRSESGSRSGQGESWTRQGDGSRESGDTGEQGRGGNTGT